MYKIKLQQFEGPLDLLLRLIEEEKLEITTISLSQVTEQFLEHLTAVEERHPEELADFLVVAAKLLLIKSRTLLPSFAGPEEGEVDLEQQLKIYREFHEASKRLQRLIAQRYYTFARQSSLKILASERRYRPPENLAMDDLGRFFRLVLRRLEPFLKIPEEVIERTINIRETIDTIRQRILDQASVSFQTLLEQAQTRTEVIITFLALLELVKQRAIVVMQEGIFTPIAVQRRSETVNSPTNDTTGDQTNT